MKNFLHTLPYFLIFFLLIGFQPKIFGQCSCPNGDPLGTVVHTQVFDSVTAINTTIDYPKFDPSIGTLACLQLASTVTTVGNFHLYNFESHPETYRLESFRRSQFSGPGGFFSSSNSPITIYGPYDLEAADPILTNDEVEIGPDTMFSSKYTQTNLTSGLSNYMGVGNVSFNYLNTSTTTLLDGSSNMDFVVRAYTRLTASLTYFWCPSTILATNIRNFSAFRKDDFVLLKWFTENKIPGTNYEIEYSSDGNNFSNIGEIDPKDINGTTTQHEFRYSADGSATGKMYFRIKQRDAQGKVTYSPIRIVNMNENVAAGFIIYPNPVSSKVSMQFDRSLSGNYVVEVTNLAGQIMYNRGIKLNNNNNVQFEMSNPPPSGMYYLKITDTKTRLSFSNKLIIRR